MKNILEELAVTIFRAQFVRFEGHSLFDESELGDVPVGWNVCELGEVLEVLETGSRPTGGVKEINSGIPSIGAESIVGLGKFDYNKTKFISISFFERVRRGHIRDMDVLIYKDGGKPGQFEPHISIFGSGFPFEKASINEHVYRTRVKPPLSQTFLYFWLTTPLMMEEMRRRGTGVAIPGLNSTAVRELPIIIPPREIVERFDAIAEPIIRKLLIEATPTFPLNEAPPPVSRDRQGDVA